MDSLANTMAGASAGVIEIVLLQPMLYCKNATQQNLPLSANPRVLYRGAAVSATNMAVLTGIQFPIANFFGNIIGTPGTERTPFQTIAAGFGGGAVSGIACAPMELTMVQQQRFGGSLLGTAGGIIKRSAPDIFRGFVTSSGREAVFAAGYIGIGPELGKWLREEKGFSVAASKFSGSVGAGLIAATLSHPLDTIKTCMQGDVKREKYTTLTKTARTLLQEGGHASFFRGWTWRVGRMICAMFILGECHARLIPFYSDLLGHQN